MSKPVCRVSDVSTGHSCFPPNPVIKGSPDVFVNDKPAARVGDKLQPHCCPMPPYCHPSTITTGAKTVFCNNIPLARVTSENDCPQIMMTGSHNVFVGD